MFWLLLSAFWHGLSKHTDSSSRRCQREGCFIEINACTAHVWSGQWFQMLPGISVAVLYWNREQHFSCRSSVQVSAALRLAVCQWQICSSLLIFTEVWHLEIHALSLFFTIWRWLLFSQTLIAKCFWETPPWNGDAAPNPLQVQIN